MTNQRKYAATESSQISRNSQKSNFSATSDKSLLNDQTTVTSWSFEIKNSWLTVFLQK